MNAIIIDDEAKARQNIINLIKLTKVNISILHEANNVNSGFEAIRKFEPDLIFLDIQMPDGSGFNLLKKFEKINFQVIFITAFDQYAIDAFKYNAIDYLLKPINPIDFKAAVERANLRVKNASYYLNIEKLIQSLDAPAEKNKIVLKTSEGMHLVHFNDIIRCESDKGYTFFYLTNNRKILVSNILKNFKESLPEKYFLRTHQSHLVNIDYIQSFIKADGGYILLKDGSTVPVAKRKREEIISFLENMAC